MRLIDADKATQERITKAAAAAGLSKGAWLEARIAAALEAGTVVDADPIDEHRAAAEFFDGTEEREVAETMAAENGTGLAAFVRSAVSRAMRQVVGRNVDGLGAVEHVPAPDGWRWDPGLGCYVNDDTGIDVRYQHGRWAIRRRRAATGQAGFNDWIHPSTSSRPDLLDSPHRWREALAAALATE